MRKSGEVGNITCQIWLSIPCNSVAPESLADEQTDSPEWPSRMILFLAEVCAA